MVAIAPNTYSRGGANLDDIATTATTVTVTDMAGADSAWLLRDYGAGAIGDFSIAATFNVSDVDPLLNMLCPFAAANSQGDNDTLVDDEDGIAVRLTNWTSDRYSLRIANMEGDTTSSSSSYLDADTDYFLTFDRTGTTGTLTIRTGSHAGSVVDTLTLTVPATLYRYFYLTQSSASSGNVPTAETSYTMTDITATGLDLVIDEGDCVITTRMRAKNLSRALNGSVSLRARLFTNDATLTETMVPAAFTEPTFTGYTQLPITTVANSSLAYAPGVAVVSDEPQLKFDELVWINQSASTVTIYGFYVIDTQLAGHGDVAAACKFETPREISPAGKLKIPIDWLSLDAS
jgi:hypothetical protein